MALDFDTSEPFDDLRPLVDAIIEGDIRDESDWLEWKTDPDLTTKEGRFLVAKVILGMANRNVDAAARSCDGFGYLVLGAEPSNLVGINVPDPADWIEGVEVYVKGKSGGPRWDATILTIDNKDVLVIAVDPPQDGDPLWPLRKEFTPQRSGTVFVRKPGKAEPANAEDVEMLVQRVRDGDRNLPQLSVEIVGDTPLPWLDWRSTDKNVAEWVNGEMKNRMEAARKIDDERNWNRPTAEAPQDPDNHATQGPITQALVASVEESTAKFREAFQSLAVKPFQDMMDKRKLEGYGDELQAWGKRLHRSACNDLPHRYCNSGYGLVRLRVSNPSNQYLDDVEVLVQIEFSDTVCFDTPPDGARLPEAPRPFGTARALLAPSAVLTVPIAPLGARSEQKYSRNMSVGDEPTKLTFTVGALRPQADVLGDQFYIFLRKRPSDGLLRVSWTATVKHRHGIIQGRSEAHVQSHPVAVGDLLSLPTGDGEGRSTE